MDLRLSVPQRIALEISASLEAAAPFRGYRQLGPRAHALLESAERTVGAAGVEELLRQVASNELARLEVRLAARRAAGRIPEAFVPEIERCARRLAQDVASRRAGFFRLDNDLFIKDLAVCRLVLLPCGIEFVDTCTGIPRRSLLAAGARGALPWLRGIARLGGLRPALNGHLDRRNIAQFTREGYRRCYRLIAELLRAEPSFLGYFGESWLLDPCAAEISPELAFLRDDPAAGGATFCAGPSDSTIVADAIRLSPKRRALHESGQYRPRSWMVIWPRAQLLRWAELNPG